MFDKVMGLPLHVLVLHFVVVLIPLGATATVGVMLRPAWRDRFALVVAAGNIGFLALTFLTVRAGFALQDKLDPTHKNIPNNAHQVFGETLLWIVLALAIVSTVAWLATRAENFTPAALTGLAAVVAVLAMAAAGMTVVTGHTGSQSHWGALYK